tara:strand:+ start:3835 stop:4041 length:207 start_codon:yes stop_codon:yes gene_type:complete
MSLRLQLKNLKRSLRGRRWTIRKVKNELTEVKMIFNPDEYSKYKGAKKMYTDKQLLKILENARPDNNK